jgi:Ca2+-binding RTX toxin-like protein
LNISKWFYSSKYQLEVLQLSDGTTLDITDVEAKAHIFKATESGGYMYGFSDRADTLLGSTGNDIFYGKSGNDTLQGNFGNDRLFGDSGNDTLHGGSGSDYLQGDAGNDTYHWSIGDGNDTIYDYSYTDYYSYRDSHSDTLIFGEGLTAENISWVRSNNDLIASITTADDASTQLREQLSISNWFSGSKYQLEVLQLSDGTTLDIVDVEAKAHTFKAAESGGTMYGFSDRADTLQGNVGNDRLFGKSGNDTLHGGSGSDYLRGDAGNDTYHWGIGDGNDTIYDYSYTDYYSYRDSHSDTLIFGEGLTAENISWVRSNNDLIASITTADDASTQLREQLTINKWFSGSKYQLEVLQLSDGTTLDIADVEAKAHIFKATESGGYMYGFSDRADTLQGNIGNDRLFGKSGNDTLHGGRGSDYLQGDTGNDTYHWGIGDGNDTINDYNWSDYYSYRDSHSDTLIFGEGLTAENISWVRSNNDLIASITTADDTGTQLMEQLKISKWFSGSKYQLEVLQLTDGRILDIADVEARAHTFKATESGGYMYGFKDRADTLLGNVGNDTLFGKGGNDNLYGSSGSDYLQGDAGNDTYHWGIGDGNDTINDYNWTDYYSYRDSHSDTLIFGKGLAHNDISLTCRGNDLVASITNATANGSLSSGELTIKNWFRGSAYQLEKFELASGMFLTNGDVNQLVRQMATFADDNGFALDSVGDVRSNEHLMTMVANSWHS